MNLNQIAKELEQKAEQRDKKGILGYLKEVPDFYASLIDHTNLQILKDECSKLEAKIKDWKWPSLTDKFFDKESLVKWSEGKPVPKHRTIVDDIHTFAELLRSFAKGSRKGMPVAEANLLLRPIIKKDPCIKTKPAAELVGCSESTIVKTAVWKSVKEPLKKGRKPKAQRLTDARLKTTSAEAAKLHKLVDEQYRDSLEDGPKEGRKQRKVHPSV